MSSAELSIKSFITSGPVVLLCGVFCPLLLCIYLTRGSVHDLSFICVIQRDNWETLNIVAEKPFLPEIRGWFLLFLDCTSSILSGNLSKVKALMKQSTLKHQSQQKSSAFAKC